MINYGDDFSVFCQISTKKNGCFLASDAPYVTVIVHDMSVVACYIAHQEYRLFGNTRRYVWLMNTFTAHFSQNSRKTMG